MDRPDLSVSAEVSERGEASAVIARVPAAILDSIGYDLARSDTGLASNHVAGLPKQGRRQGRRKH